MTVQSNAEASEPTAVPPAVLQIAERITALHAEYANVTVAGNNLQYRIEALVAEVRKLDERRSEIWKELRSIADPGPSDMMHWGV